jgi:hypothetical protein
MPIIGAITSFSANTLAQAGQVNSNFTTIKDAVNTYAVFKDVASQIITKTLTFTPDASFGIDVTTGGIRVQAGGLTITGNSTITGTLGGLTGLTVTSGGATITAGGLTVTAGNLTMSGGQAIAKRVDDGDSGTSKTIDFNGGNIHRVRLTGNCTFTFSNPQTGGTYRLECLQDTTGSRTVTWPATVKWDNNTTPTLTTTVSRKDTFDFYYNGGVYIGTTHSLNVADTT